ncbi:hypothetical protein [Rhizobium sp. ZPR3]|uniref:Cytochrome P450 n=2 Tax=unclassified Rhizobium TaxID=2613769 RepID=A0AAU7SS76_9HYPH
MSNDRTKIVSARLAKEILANSDAFLNGPLKENIAKVRAQSGIPLVDTEDFFATWPIYSLGEEHDIRRKVVARAVGGSWDNAIGESVSILKAALDSGCIDDTTITESTDIFFNKVFGMSDHQRQLFLTACQPLTDFQLRQVPFDTMSDLDDRVKDLTRWFDGQLFTPGAVIEHMRDLGAPTYLSMSVVLDAYKPLHAGLSSVVHCSCLTFLTECNSDVKAVVRNILKAHPPFQNITRKDMLGKFSDGKISIDLRACHGQSSDELEIGGSSLDGSFLTFGYGPHACLGRGLALRWFHCCVELLQGSIDSRWSVVGTEVQDEALCSFQNIAVTLS